MTLDGRGQRITWASPIRGNSFARKSSLGGPTGFQSRARPGLPDRGKRSLRSRQACRNLRLRDAYHLCREPARISYVPNRLRLRLAYGAMTRGRRRDPTLQPSRQLQTARAFRERKAVHLRNLEATVKKQEAELVELRRRLDINRGGQLPETSFSPGAAQSTPYSAKSLIQDTKQIPLQDGGAQDQASCCRCADMRHQLGALVSANEVMVQNFQSSRH